MAAPVSIVIFGATGDLTSRKLVPSLYNLCRKKRLGPEVRIVGVARTAMSDDGFRERLAPAAREFAKGEWSDDTWAHFARRLHYIAADAGAPGGLEAVDAALKKLEGGEAARLYYLSVGPDVSGKIIARLGETGQAEGGAWRRVVLEKPFGTDAASARVLNGLVLKHFREEQVFRIDHYLGKETVQNVLAFRFANTLFEPLWCSRFIDHVQITAAEEVKVGSRAGYYDGSGVLRDMFQNHLLQVLACVAKEAPASLDAGPLRDEKVKLLDAVRVPDAAAARRLVSAQYEGYRREKGVRPDSRTPTFAALTLAVDNERWAGVPFHLRSGKGLKRRLTEVVIQFRCPVQTMFARQSGPAGCNRVAIRIQPDEGIHVNFQSKVPDAGKFELRPTSLDFNYAEAYPDAPIPEAYERLLQDALAGDASLFMRGDEIERAWEIIDPFVQASEAAEPEAYPVGSWGPAGAEEMLARDGRTWLSPCVPCGDAG